MAWFQVPFPAFQCCTLKGIVLRRWIRNGPGNKNLHIASYRKPGNFRCKNIFVVNGGYEN